MLKETDVDIACMRCKNARRGCTFSPWELGVVVLPTVLYTARSAAFRAKVAPAKQGSRKKSEPIEIEDEEDEEDNEVEIVEVDDSIRSGIEMSAPVQETGENLPSMVGEQAEITERDEGVGNVKNVGDVGTQVPSGWGGIPLSVGVVPPPAGGRTYPIFHEDVSRIERQLIDPNRTMSSLEQAKIELWGAIDREEQQLANIRDLTSRRKDLWQSIERHINTEIDRIGGYGSRRSMAGGDHAVNEDTMMGGAGGSNQQQDLGIAKRRG